MKENDRQIVVNSSRKKGEESTMLGQETWDLNLRAPPPSLKLGARKMRIELEAKGRQEASVPGTLER